MKGNHELPNNHFKKTAKRFKTWFDQAAKKQKRRKIRQEKEAKISPMPLKKLRPVVRCPTIRYNTKQRLGKGFTPEECQAAGLDFNYARTVGIAVDYKRRNMNKETFDSNVERIKVYYSRLTIYKNKKEAKGAKQFKGKIMPVVRKEIVVEAVKVSEIK